MSAGFLEEQYSAALQAYVGAPTEALRERGYQLGTDTISSGLGVLDVAAAHEEALPKALMGARSPEEVAEMARRAAEFLMESLAPFEMTHRGYQETIGKLIATNEALRQSEAKNRALLDAIPDLMFRVSREGTYLDFIVRGIGAVGVPPGDVVGKKVSEVLPAKLAHQVLTGVERALQTSTIQILEYQLVLNGDRHDYEARLVISGKDEVLGIVRDVTELRQAEEARARLIREQTARAEAEAAQRRIRSILESITDSFIALDRQWRYTYVNRQAERLLRRRREELIGKNFWEETPEAVGSMFDEAFHRAAAEQVTVDLVELYPPLAAWIEAHIYPAVDGLAVYFTDITERKRAETEREQLLQTLQDANEQLQSQSEELRVQNEELQSQGAELRNLAAEVQRRAAELQTVIAGIADAVLVCDNEGRITLANEAALALTGVAQTEAVGTLADYTRALQLRFPDGRPLPLGDLGFARALQGELVPARQELGTHPVTQRRIDLLLSAAPLRDATGHVIGAVEVVRDISELMELDRLKDQFIAVAAHELKTPVTIMKGYAQALLRLGQAGSPTQRKMLDNIDRGADRIEGIIEDLLDISKLQTGRMELRGEQIDLPQLVEEQVDRLALTTTKHRLRLVQAQPVVIHGDRGRLEQVLATLLDNAVRYSPEGGDVGVAVRVEGDEAVVAVADQGVGIPQRKQARIFQRFYRAHTGTPYDYGGMGVGLFIAKEIVERHGGRMWFVSEEGKGSTFSFALPLTK